MFDVDAIRKDFPVLSRVVNGKPLVYLDNAATSQKPRQVIHALTDFYERYNSNIHRAVHTLGQEATAAYEAAREKVARFIGSPSTEEIVFVRNATEAINLVSNTWAVENIRAGDEILLTEMEHLSNLVPWQKVALDKGATLRFIPLKEDWTLDLSHLDTLLTPRTKLVAFTHMSNVLGTITPAKQITEAAHRVGARVLIDGAQSVPHFPVDVAGLGCDFYAFSSHKMLGPTGIGVLYARQELLEAMPPFLRGGEMVMEVWPDRATWNDLPMRFEAGTPNIADAVALGAAVDYLQALGMENVRQHEIDLTCYALKAFKELEERLTMYGPTDLAVRGGVISFYSSVVHPHDIGTALDQLGIAIRTGHHCAQPLMRKLQVPATARASFYIYNTQSEVDALVSGLKHVLDYFGNGRRSL